MSAAATGNFLIYWSDEGKARANLDRNWHLG